MSCKQSQDHWMVSKLTKGCLISAVMVPMAIIPIQSAFAVSGSVKRACKGDYLTFCSAHAVGSKGLRTCMRSAGRKLSKRCVRALVASGEISRSELARYAKRSRR